MNPGPRGFLPPLVPRAYWLGRSQAPHPAKLDDGPFPGLGCPWRGVGFLAAGLCGWLSWLCVADCARVLCVPGALLRGELGDVVAWLSGGGVVPPPGFEPGTAGSPRNPRGSIPAVDRWVPYESGALTRLSYGGTM